jgi:hypothetical protein
MLINLRKFTIINTISVEVIIYKYTILPNSMLQSYVKFWTLPNYLALVNILILDYPELNFRYKRRKAALWRPFTLINYMY